MRTIIHKPVQDRLTATWWLDEAIRETKRLSAPSGNIAYAKFTERMIKGKYRIELWQLAYIGEKFEYNPTWATLKFKYLLQQHK